MALVTKPFSVREESASLAEPGGRRGDLGLGTPHPVACQSDTISVTASRAHS